MAAKNGERIDLEIYQAWLLQAAVNMWIRYLSLDAAGDDGSLYPKYF